VRILRFALAAFASAKHEIASGGIEGVWQNCPEICHTTQKLGTFCPGRSNRLLFLIFPKSLIIFSLWQIVAAADPLAFWLHTPFTQIKDDWDKGDKVNPSLNKKPGNGARARTRVSPRVHTRRLALPNRVAPIGTTRGKPQSPRGMSWLRGQEGKTPVAQRPITQPSYPLTPARPDCIVFKVSPEKKALAHRPRAQSPTPIAPVSPIAQFRPRPFAH
jgi:hypothetical protein